MPFKKGHTTNLGRKRSAETLKKMSESHKGLKPSSWGAGFTRGNNPWNKRGSVARNAYFAGLVDGEGSIFITNNGKGEGIKYKKLCIAISMVATKAQPLPEGYALWGGSLHNRKERTSMNKEVLDWRLWTKDAEKFLISILPYLKIKKRQAEIALEFRKLQRRGRPFHQPIKEEELVYRQKLIDEIKLLNH